MPEKFIGHQSQSRQSPANHPATASGHKFSSVEFLHKSLEQTELAVKPFEDAFHSARKKVQESKKLLAGAREALSQLNHLKHDYETKKHTWLWLKEHGASRYSEDILADYRLCAWREMYEVGDAQHGNYYAKETALTSAAENLKKHQKDLCEAIDVYLRMLKSTRSICIRSAVALPSLVPQDPRYKTVHTQYLQAAHTFETRYNALRTSKSSDWQSQNPPLADISF